MTFPDDAACVGDWHPFYAPGLVSPRGGISPDQRHAISICERCPVAAPCLTYALDMEAAAPGRRYGIFGGTTPDQRAQLARQKGVA